MNIPYRKLVVATFGSVVSCAIMLQANQAKAAIFSFTQGYSVGSMNYGVLPSFNPPTTLSGTFTGTDLNNDGVISGNEVTSFDLNLTDQVIDFDNKNAPGVPVNNGYFVSYRLSDKSLSYTASVFSTITLPLPPPPGVTFADFEVSTDSGFYGVSFLGTGGVHGYYLGGYSGTPREQPVVVTEVPVPEPLWGLTETLLAFGGLGLLAKRKITSLTKFPLKLNSIIFDNNASV